MQRFTKYFAMILVFIMLVSLIPFVPVQAASLSVDPDSGYYGQDDKITITGTGFTAGTIYYITCDLSDEGAGTDKIITITAASDGTLSGEFEVDKKNIGIGGEHRLDARASSASGTSAASTTFTVEPVITISKEKVSAGSALTVSGYGFGYEEEVTITINDIDVATDTADEYGYFSCSVTVPSSLTSDDYDVSAYGDDTDTDDVNVATIEVEANAVVSMSPTSGKSGSNVTVSGQGFAASENIQIYMNGIQVSSARSSSSGSWSANFTIPQLGGGSYPVMISGSETKDAPSLTFTISSGITLSKTSGPPGTVVTVSGYGFASGEQGITVTYDGNPIGNPASAGSNGAWSTSFTVPAGNAGNHAVSAYGSSTSQMSPANFTVSAGITINKDSGPVGSPLTVNGTGFGAGEKTINVLFDGTTVGAAVTANTSGAWSANITIPSASGGDHIIDAQGATTKATSIGDLTFTVKPAVTINKTSGASGASISISGTGFAAGEKNISIDFDDSNIASGITADKNGSWTTSVTVPPMPSGSHVIKINGPTSQTIESGDINFKIAAGISVDPSVAPVGANINISGSGFTPNSSLRVSYDDVDLSIGRISTDATGSFSKTIPVPKSVAGSHSIKVTDTQGNSGTVTFDVDSTPPSAPKLQAPADTSKSGFFGGATPTFQWQKSTGTSAVTYVLQIDTQKDFPEPILEKTDLTSTKYTLSDSEALPTGKYYWRVKAVDSASNSSDWSQTFRLKSGSISVALFIIILILVIAILVGLYFLFGRKLLARVLARKQGTISGVPSVVNAEYRIIDQEDPDKKKLPWRLALPQAPQPPKGGKNLSSEDQARLKVIIDFAMSLPLAKPGNDANWLVELAENESGNTNPVQIYNALLKGEIQPHYEPAWMRHPTFLDLQVLLEGQTILQDLNSYIESFNRAASESVTLLQNIYKETSAEITWDVISNEGWGYVSGVYTDSVSWFLGKQLREPSERNYTVKPKQESTDFGLYGEQNTAFYGLLVFAPDEEEATVMRTLHIKLRKSYRNNEKVREVVSMITQLDVQRNRLIAAFSQFSKLNT